MRQKATGIYNKQYYIDLFGEKDYSKPLEIDKFGPIYKKIAKLALLSDVDLVVDYGCGGGDLSFYLQQKYKCSIIGIDYSPDAIRICKDKLKKYRQVYHISDKIKFLKGNYDNLPRLKNISILFFCDVLEHIYDKEIALLLKSVRMWGGRGGKIRLLVHTDNDFYLRFIRPLVDFLSLILFITNIKSIRERNKFEKERHINLTNPLKLKIKMERWGFREIKLRYPEITKNMIKMQLRTAKNIPLLIDIFYVILRRFTFLCPSFYAVYEDK